MFGAAIGSRMTEVDGVPYAAFIVPGLIILSLFTESISNASFGIYFPKFTGTIYELLSAPVSYLEIVLAYVGAAATTSRPRTSDSAPLKGRPTTLTAPTPAMAEAASTGS